jgi:cytochrome c5
MRRGFHAAVSALLLSLTSAAAAPAQDPKAADLPDGEGRKILERACTSCHGLDEVTKFKGFYDRKEWRDVVTTMVQYGAELKEGEPDVLVEYLTKNFGKKE